MPCAMRTRLCRQQLTECFGLMDADGSGSIDVDELGAAFKLLGEWKSQRGGHAETGC